MYKKHEIAPRNCCFGVITLCSPNFFCLFFTVLLAHYMKHNLSFGLFWAVLGQLCDLELMYFLCLLFIPILNRILYRFLTVVKLIFFKYSFVSHPFKFCAGQMCMLCTALIEINHKRTYIQ